MADYYRLTLFISGRSQPSERAVEQVRRLCDGALAGLCELEVVDVAEHPQRARGARALVTPVVVRQQPPPERRLVGDLSDPERVIARLELPDAARIHPAPDRTS